MRNINIKNIINWKIFFILLAACVIASLLVLPYTLAITSSEIEITPLLLILQTAQSIIMFAVVIFLGLLLSKQIGMGLPILQGALEGKNQSKEIKSILLISILLGVISGVIIILASIIFDRFIPEFQNAAKSAAAWKGFLASFYGGIAEEVLLRLFFLSLLVWITFIIKKTKDGEPVIFGIWFAIILAAVIFGLGHLPATARIAALNGLVITRAVVLNGIAGVVFGWLYWKKGLESAIIAHFCADIVLHVITPLVVSLFS